MIDARGVQRCARAGGLCFGIENFRGGNEVPRVVATAGDQDPAIGERGGGVTCARNGEVIERLDLLRTRGAHPCGDRQQDDRAEERKKVAEDVISFGSSLHFGLFWGLLEGSGGTGGC